MRLTTNQIISVFGDYTPYLNPFGVPSVKWELLILDSIRFPEPLAYGGVLTKFVRCHKKIALHLKAALDECYSIPEVWSTINDHGGCYNFRLQRNSATELSRHCWGIAIDLDVVDNPMGEIPRVNPKTVEIFERHGFLWGGNFSLKHRDGMHFEFYDLRKL